MPLLPLFRMFYELTVFTVQVWQTMSHFQLGEPIHTATLTRSQ